MQFREARDKLKELAKGRFYLIQFRLTGFEGGKEETRCSMYLSTGTSGIGANEATFQECFYGLMKKLHPDSGGSEEMPDIYT
jgi:hypothetical protein